MSKNIDPGEEWRLLRDDEITANGDQGTFVYDGEIHAWTPVKAGLQPNHSWVYRRRITDGWIKTSERLPTKEDADEFGNVLIYAPKLTKCACRWDAIDTTRESHWSKLPSSPIPEQSEGDKAFEAWVRLNTHLEWSREKGWSGSLKPAWDARGEWEKTRGKK